MADKNRVVNVYSTKVKVTGWNEDHSYPRDNDPYNPCKRNYFLSTHKRFGNDDSTVPISTTREMQQQVLFKGTITKRCAPMRAVQRQGSYKDSCKYIMREGLGVHPMDYFITDYISTNKYEYRHPNPHLEKPMEIDLTPPPPIYRKVDTCGTNSKFLDESKCIAMKCYPDHKSIPPYVNLDLYYNDHKNTKVVKEPEVQVCPQVDETDIT